MENMKSIDWLVLIALLLVSCRTSRSTTTPTQVPLADLELEAILINPGDLPMGYVAGQVQDSLPGMFDGIPQPVNQIYQQIDQNNTSGSGGGVSVIVYDSAADSTEAYDTILLGMGSSGQNTAIENLGEKANKSGWILLFLRCYTIVYFRMVGTNYDQYLSYGQKLDKRLIPLVCP
jgi:hypothetical protein